LEPHIDPETPVTIAVDVATRQIVSLEVTDERTGDGRMLVPLVMQAEIHCRVEGVLIDGGYDACAIFAYLDEKGIEAGIKVRRNSSRRNRGPRRRSWRRG